MVWPLVTEDRDRLVNEQRGDGKQLMSQVRLGATCLLVRAMFRNGQVRQAQMQGMRWKGDDHSLPECSLTQAEAFSNLDDLRPSGSLKASRRRSPTSRRRSTASVGTLDQRVLPAQTPRSSRGVLSCQEPPRSPKRAQKRHW